MKTLYVLGDEVVAGGQEWIGLFFGIFSDEQERIGKRDLLPIGANIDLGLDFLYRPFVGQIIHTHSKDILTIFEQVAVLMEKGHLQV
ncbi:MAG: Uncharacterised protein [Flavobacteriia bacterium]|nr:MAG: Uncharacterised protein [Flavobacteriia bacterium]